MKSMAFPKEMIQKSQPRSPRSFGSPGEKRCEAIHQRGDQPEVPQTDDFHREKMGKIWKNESFNMV